MEPQRPAAHSHCALECYGDLSPDDCLFYDRLELRAVWRLLIFLSMIVALGYATNLIVRRVLRGTDDTTLFLVGELIDFLTFLFASWIMGRIDGLQVILQLVEFPSPR